MRESKRLLWRLFAVLAIVLMVAAACGGDDEEGGGTDTGTGAAEEEADAGDGVLKLGYLLPSTGDLAFLGPPMIKGVEMAIRDINDAGGVLDKPVEVLGADDGGTTNNDLATSNADRMVTIDKVDAIIGAAGSSSSKAIIDKVTGAGIVQCSPSNSSKDFTTIDDNGGFYFRTAPPDTLQAPALADVITGDGHDKIAIIALNDPYGKGFSEDLKPALEDAGASVVETVLYDPKAPTFDADVKKLAAADPDAVAIIALPDTGGRVLAAMIEQQIGPDKMPIYVTDGMQSKSIYKAVDEKNPAVTQGIRGTAPAAAPKGGRPGFAEEYAAFAPGTDSIYSAHAYDCVTMIALAAVVAESDDPAKIQKQINKVTKGGTKCTSFEECAELAADGKDIDYDGASGPLQFIDAGEPGAGAYDVYEFQADGTYKTEDEQINID